MGIDGDIGNIRFSWNVSGLGTSGRCPVQLEFDIFNPSDRVIDALAVPDFKIIPNCPELETKSQPFWVDSRTVSNHICHVVCFDRMSRVNVPFSTSHNWNDVKTITGNQALTDICRICGFESSGMSGGALGGLEDIKFTELDVSEKTCGEILDIISTVMVGVWTCSGSSLFLACFGNTSDGAVVQPEKYTEIEYQGRTRIMGLVMQDSSAGETYSFGTTVGNGYVIQVESEFVNETLAGKVWGRLRDYEYKAWNCEKANITTKNFSFGGVLQFAYIPIENNVSESLESPLYPRSVNYSVDSTGIYFNGGCSPVDEWNYESKLEREKIGIGKSVGSATTLTDGKTVYYRDENT